jgi:16S rRNA (adenine1518-N6/adenine1519-N6)-dimethyltransferase
MKTLLEQQGFEPKRSLGQNFIHDANVLAKIVASADVTAETTVLEIGAGAGTLTEQIAQRAGRVIAVEIDARLEPLLRQRLAAYPQVELLFADFLTVDLTTLFGDQPYIVIANVPYYITSAILRHLFESSARPTHAVMTVQLEVAQRLLAKPGDMSLLSVSVQFYARPRLIMKLNPAVFYPRPDVTSAVIRLDTYPQPAVAVPDATRFFQIVRAGFSQKRKQLKNALADGLHLGADDVLGWLARAEIDPQRRAETLSLAEWAALAHADSGG